MGKNWGEAANWAKSKLNGIDLNNPQQVMSLLRKEGWKDGMMGDLMKWGKGAAFAAKMGKKVGIDPLAKMGIDVDKIDINELEKTARSFLGSQSEAPQQYASYDQRNVPAYQGASYSSRASRLPD